MVTVGRVASGALPGVASEEASSATVAEASLASTRGSGGGACVRGALPGAGWAGATGDREASCSVDSGGAGGGLTGGAGASVVVGASGDRSGCSAVLLDSHAVSHMRTSVPTSTRRDGVSGVMLLP